MKNVLFILVIVWFVLGCSVANDRGYFNASANRNCTFIGSALLTVVAGPVNYLGRPPSGLLLTAPGTDQPTGGSARSVPSHVAATGPHSASSSSDSDG